MRELTALPCFPTCSSPLQEVRIRCRSLLFFCMRHFAVCLGYFLQHDVCVMKYNFQGATSVSFSIQTTSIRDPQTATTVHSTVDKWINFPEVSPDVNEVQNCFTSIAKRAHENEFQIIFAKSMALRMTPGSYLLFVQARTVALSNESELNGTWHSPVYFTATQLHKRSTTADQ